MLATDRMVSGWSGPKYLLASGPTGAYCMLWMKSVYRVMSGEAAWCSMWLMPPIRKPAPKLAPLAVNSWFSPQIRL